MIDFVETLELGKKLGAKTKATQHQKLKMFQAIDRDENLNFIHFILETAIASNQRFGKEDSEVLMIILRGDENWKPYAQSIMIGMSDIE